MLRIEAVEATNRRGVKNSTSPLILLDLLFYALSLNKDENDFEV